MYLEKPFLSLALVCGFLCTSVTHADTDLGNGYTCVDSSIINKKGKTQAFAAFKKGVNRKISANKVKLDAAKADQNKGKITSLNIVIKGLRDLKKKGQDCSDGKFEVNVSPVWDSIKGTYIGEYSITLLPDLPFGTGQLKVENTFDGKISLTKISFLTGIVYSVFPETSEFDFDAESATFPASDFVPGTPLGDLTVTLFEDGKVKIETVLQEGTFKGSTVKFDGAFSGSTFPGNFTIGSGGADFAKGDFVLNKQ